MRHLITTTAVLLVLASGCRSLNESDPTTRGAPKTTTITGTTGGMDRGMFVELPEDYHAPSAPLEAAPAKAWSEVMQVYTELAVPVTRLDNQRMQIVSQGFNVQRRFLGAAASKYFDCGVGMAGMRRADTYRIMGVLQTIITPTEGGHSQILTSLRARGFDETGGSANAVPCTSTGELEKYIANAVALRTLAGH